MKKIRLFINLIKIFATLLCISATVFFVMTEGAKRNAHLEEEAYLRQKIAEEEQTHRDLILERERTLSDFYIERIARERLGLVREHEIIFVNTGQ